MSSVPGNRLENQDDDTRAEAASVISDLKEQVQKAETVSEQYRKQLGVLQMRLDDAISEQGKSEDQAHEKDRIIASQQEEVRQLSRRLREMEQAHETELASVLKDKEHLVNKEEDLQDVIQRLKETIAQKDPRMNVDGERNLSRSCKFFFFSISDLPWMNLLAIVACANVIIDYSKFQEPVNRWRKRTVCSVVATPTEPLSKQFETHSTKGQAHRVSTTGARRDPD